MKNRIINNLLYITITIVFLFLFSSCSEKNENKNQPGNTPQEAVKSITPSPSTTGKVPESSQSPAGVPPQDSTSKDPKPSPSSKKNQAKKIDEMVYIPGGTFIMGSGEENQLKKREVKLTPFYIDRYPVTYSQFNKFLKETGYKCEVSYHGDELKKPGNPVTMVTYKDAEQYAKWAGKRLPTEAEWEMAARGTDGRIYPWGNNWKKGGLDFASKGPHKAGEHPQSASPYGVEDMAGNIFHWTSNSLPDFKNPESSVVRIIKAGGWTYFPKWNRCSFRSVYPEKEYSYFIGFRCVKPVDVKNDINLKKSKDKNNPSIAYKQENFDLNDDILFLFRPQLWPIRTLTPKFEKEVNSVKKGQVVVDVGCGLGYLAYRLLPLVGESGKVYAVDISESSIEFIKVYAKKEGMKNLVPVLSKPDDISVPANTCDVVFLFGTIHCLAPDSIVKPFYLSCHRALKKGGKLVVVEMPGFENVPPRMKIIEKLGFKKISLGKDKSEVMGIYVKE